MRLNDDSWRSEEEPDRWEPLVIEPVWNGFCFRSLLMRILNNEQMLHFFCRHKNLDGTHRCGDVGATGNRRHRSCGPVRSSHGGHLPGLPEIRVLQGSGSRES